MPDPKPHSANDEVFETIGALATLATHCQRVSMQVNDVGTEHPILDDEKVVELYERAEAILDKASQDLFDLIRAMRASIGKE
jgi:hypothetical protein